MDDLLLCRIDSLLTHIDLVLADMNGVSVEDFANQICF